MLWECNEKGIINWQTNLDLMKLLHILKTYNKTGTMSGLSLQVQTIEKVRSPFNPSFIRSKGEKVRPALSCDKDEP
jgi:hypothetical protein